MNKEEAEQKEIKVYWWNFGSKTLDFKGSYKEFLLQKGIKIRKIKHPSVRDTEGHRFKIPVGSAIITFDIFSGDYIANFDSAIKLFLTYLGDKTKFEGYGRTYLLNWS